MNAKNASEVTQNNLLVDDVLHGPGAATPDAVPNQDATAQSGQSSEVTPLLHAPDAPEPQESEPLAVDAMIAEAAAPGAPQASSDVAAKVEGQVE